MHCLVSVVLTQFNVKAILDWKRSCYGDPLSDVAYFLMPVFLRPSDYGTVTASEDNKLLLSGKQIVVLSLPGEGYIHSVMLDII